MKSIMYVGAVLMTGACIYGFVDYRKANSNEEFKSLYRSEAAATKASPSDQQVSDIKNIEKVNEKVVSALPAAATKLTAGEKLEPAKELKEAKSTDSKRKSSKRKKLNYKLYSRAALERLPEIEEKIEKTEKK